MRAQLHQPLRGSLLAFVVGLFLVAASTGHAAPARQPLGPVDVFLQVTLTNPTTAPLWVGSAGSRERYEPLEPGESLFLTAFVTGPEYSYESPPPDVRKIEAIDAGQAVVFCHVFSGQDLKQLQWHIELTPGQLDCGQLNLARPLVSTLRPYPRPGAPIPALDGPFTGEPDAIAVREDDLGPGWSLAEEWRDGSDLTTTGTLWRRFRLAPNAEVLAAATVFRTRSGALDAWRGVPGGSLNVCEASLQAQFDDGRTAGACLVQNVLTQMVGGSVELITSALGATGERVAHGVDASSGRPPAPR